jgi:hypothetical protein
LAVGANWFGKESGSPGFDFEQRNSGLVLASEVSKAAWPTASHSRIHSSPTQPNLVDESTRAAVDRIPVEGPQGPCELGGSAVDCYALKPKELKTNDL